MNRINVFFRQYFCSVSYEIKDLKVFSSRNAFNTFNKTIGVVFTVWKIAIYLKTE